MSDRHVIIGAGPVGRAAADALIARGAQVVLASRSGKGPDVDGATRAAADANSADSLATLAEGAAAIYNCLNPLEYWKWPELWPPMAAALLAAAERSGAVLVTAGNLYPYGPVDGPMVEGMPDAAPGSKAQVRAKMTTDAFALHNAGKIRAVEVRGSDYMGAGPGQYAHIPRAIEAAVAGKTARVIGSSDLPHTWTDVRDMGRALATVAGEESAWGRVWHAPSNEPRTQRQAIEDVCRTVGKQPGAIKSMPRLMLTLVSPFVPVVRELKETAYQVERPYVMDSSAITKAYGLEPTPWDEVCRRTAP
ncbi:MAG: NAD-dependent epimerase/dehydratase [Marmoricola sp.]|nr:NAD-dependent epimerase/dehydratase [Marmoricola sp.]